MQTELTIPAATLFGFLMVLARVGSAMLFVPIPGLRNAPAMPRVVLALGTTMALSSSWPRSIHSPDLAQVIGWLFMEVAFGLSIGLSVAFLTEAVLMGAQIISLQAGYSYASTVDPTTQSEAGFLLIFSQLLAGLMFFGFGLDRHILRAFAASLSTTPPGTYELSRPLADIVVRSAASVFSTGLQIVLPIIALLAMVDLSLALLGRLNAQLQVITLAFPAKMLLAIALLAWILALYPTVFGESAKRTIETMYRLLR